MEKQGKILQEEIKIRPWDQGDYPLLKRLLGDPAMTVHLGGPETPEQLRSRHERYCKHVESKNGCMFVITLGTEQTPVGSVGYWEKAWNETVVWEAGWNTLPEFQGQSLATRATALMIENIRAEERHPYLHAFPSVENAASNAICRKLGFTLMGEVEFEYPVGNFMMTNDWRLTLYNAQ